MTRWVAVGLGVLLMLWVPFLYWQLQTPPRAEPGSAPDMEPPAPIADEPSAPPVAAPAAPAPAKAKPAAPAAPVPVQAEPAPAAPSLPPGVAMEVPASAPEALSELKAAYGGSSRDERAGAVEADLRAEFAKSEAPADMLRSLSCHAEACKAELVWSPELAQPFMRVAMTWAARYTAKVAMEPGPEDAQGLTPITMYFTRGHDPDEFLPPP